MPLQILVVDDNETTRKVVLEAIKSIKPSAEIATAANAFKAVINIRDSTYDLIICDVEMPDINGIEVLRYAKKRAKNKNTTVIVMSARHEYRDEALGQGADVFLKKTLNFIKELTKHIKICFPN